MATANDLSRMVPGFEFLQNLMQGAGAGIPGMSQWIAPTLDPEVIDKRIQELRTVQFWLEQNGKMLAVTIQGLEVQRMTLSTLQSMNLPLTDLREALTIKMPAGAAPPEAEAEEEAEAEAEDAEAEEAAAAPAAPERVPAIDPMKWWGALTQQFTELATKAVKDAAAGTSGLPGATPTQAPAAAPAPDAAAGRPAARRAAAPRPGVRSTKR